MFRKLIVFCLLAITVPCMAQSGVGNECTPAGTWYGGSITAYQLTVVPSTPAGHYTFTFQGIYKEPTYAITANPSGNIVKNGSIFEGAMLSLAGDGTIGTHMPDLFAGWVQMEMVDCNTLRNTIPFFGLYFGAPTQLPPEIVPPLGVDTPGIWLPGSPAEGVNWITGGKVPLLDSPDIDMILALTMDTKPIVETYHRLPKSVNPALLHH